MRTLIPLTQFVISMILAIVMTASLIGCPTTDAMDKTVPDLAGMTLQEAETALSSAGLTLGSVTQSCNNIMAVGQVIAQSIPLSSVVKPGTTVDLVLSKGPFPVSVPNLSMKTREEAEATLKCMRLSLGAVTQAYSVIVPESKVISQNPNAESEAAQGTLVAVVLSKGPAPVTVPNLAGKTTHESGMALTAAGLLVGSITMTYNETVLVGRVISHDPAAGAVIAHGSMVALTISQGPAPKPVAVPDLTGMTQPSAEAALDAAGLELGEVGDAFSETAPVDTVITQDPVANTSIQPGSAVAITLACGSAFDATSYTVDREWIYNQWQFRNPLGLDVDSTGNLYVMDTYNSRIVVFDSDGEFVRQWGTEGHADGQFFQAFAISVADGGNVYVGDSHNNRIQVFTQSGEHVATWNSYMDDNDTIVNFRRIFGVTTDANGYVYLTDSDADKIVVLTAEGEYVTSWGSWGSATGFFNEPFGIAIDSANNDVFIGDGYNNRVQKFDSNGNYKMMWGSKGSDNGQFECVQGVAVDLKGNVYAADRYNNRIQKHTTDGEFVAVIGDGMLAQPHGVAVDAQGNVYATRANPGAVYRFRPVPTP